MWQLGVSSWVLGKRLLRLECISFNIIFRYPCGTTNLSQGDFTPGKGIS